MIIRPIILVAGVTLALGGCGKQGALERPGPIWGSIPQSAPGSKAENIDPTSNNRSAREAPIPGTNDPIGAQRQGSVLR